MNAFSRVGCVLFAFCFGACATLPEVHHEVYRFPEKNVYIELPTGEFEKRPYEVLGWVRTKAKFSSLEADTSAANALCRNYYNKAANQLVREFKKAGADAVIKVRSVVLLLDGKVEEHVTPECADDGAEGEILLKGVAIKFKPEPVKAEN
jgi:hypothetical protein